MHRAVLALVSVLSLVPVIAQARAFPPGACTIADDGVATKNPSPGLTPDPNSFAPRVVQMRLPYTNGPSSSFAGRAVVDLSLAIGPGGTVSSVQILCGSRRNPEFAKAVLQAAHTWQFAPEGNGNRADYRILGGETPAAIFLGLQPST